MRSNRERPEGSESQQLEKDPIQFLSSRYHFAASKHADQNLEKLPEYVVMFSPTAKKIEELLDRAHYLAVRILSCRSFTRTRRCWTLLTYRDFEFALLSYRVVYRKRRSPTAK